MVLKEDIRDRTRSLFNNKIYFFIAELNRI